MIAEFEYYHGVVLRRIVCETAAAVKVETFDFLGRTDSFRINDKVVVHLKHSSARMSPWTFTVTNDNLREVIETRRRVAVVYFVFVCGADGLVSLSLEEFISVVESRPGGAIGLRMSRNRNEMYSVSGNVRDLPRKKREGNR